MLDAIRTLVTGPVEKAQYQGESVPDLGLTSQPRRRLAAGGARRYIQAYGGTDAIDWVADCVDLIAETTSNAAYHFEREGKRLAPADHEFAEEDDGDAPDDLANLIKRPNPFTDYTAFMELAVIDVLLAGEFFWLKYHPNRKAYLESNGKPVALYRLAPTHVDVELNENGIPGAYIYTPPGGRPVRFNPDQIIHCMRPNPHDPWRGLSKIAADPRMFDITLAQTEHVARYYEQGTTLSGTVETDRTLPPASLKKLRREFQNLYVGAVNAFRVAFLERGATFRPTSATAKDAQFEELTNLSKERITKAFRVPLPLLGEVGGSTDRQAVKEAQRIFDNKTMRPFLNRLQSNISQGLTQAWGVDFKIDYEYVMPIEDQLDLAETLAALPGVQVKDVRRQVGLPPLSKQKAEWAEIDDTILNMPGEDREAGGFPDRPLGDEAGRPPKGENTRAFPKDGRVPEGADVAKALRGRVEKLLETAKEVE